MFAHVHSEGKGYFAHGGNWMELVNKDTNGVLGFTGALKEQVKITAGKLSDNATISLEDGMVHYFTTTETTTSTPNIRFSGSVSLNSAMGCWRNNISNDCHHCGCCWILSTINN